MGLAESDGRVLQGGCRYGAETECWVSIDAVPAVPTAINEKAPVSALLWDLDNVATRRRQLPELADALIRLVGPGSVLIAAAQRSTYRATRALLVSLGLQALSGGRLASGADRQLLARAKLLHRQGVRRFVIASNDGDLARLAKLADVHVHVVTTDKSQLSAKLVAVACAMHVVQLDHHSRRPALPGTEQVPDVRSDK